MCAAAATTPKDYLRPCFFEEVQTKARFALRKAKWENRWEVEELSLIKEMAALSPYDTEFEARMKSHTEKYGLNRILDVVAKLMQLRPPSTPKAAAPILDPLLIEAPKDDPSEALRDPELFRLIAVQAKSAIAEESLGGIEMSFARQIRACQHLVDSEATPFNEALQACLGMRVLEKIAPDSLLSTHSLKDRQVTRDSILLALIGKLMKRAGHSRASSSQFHPASRPSSHRESVSVSTHTPSVSAAQVDELSVSDSVDSETSVVRVETPLGDEEADSVSDAPHLPLARSGSDFAALQAPRRAVPVYRRVKSFVASATKFGNFPDELIDPQMLKVLTEGAVCIRFLFVERYKKLFRSEEQRLIIERLFDLHLMRKTTSLGKEESLQRTFGTLLEKRRAAVLDVFKKLMSKQTISKMTKVPVFSSQTAVPSAFLQPPFHTERDADVFFKVVAYVKFICTASYSQYPEEEREMARLVLNASILRDFLHFPTGRALLIAAEEFGAINEGVMQKFIRRANLGRAWTSVDEEGDSFDGQGCLDEALESPFFNDRSFFTLLIDHVKEGLTSDACVTTRSFGELFLRLSTRTDHESSSISAIIRSSLTMNGLARIFGTDNQKKIIEAFDRALDHYRPRMPYHKCLESADAFGGLIVAAKRYAGADLNAIRVVASLKSIEALMVRMRGIGHENASAFYLNRIDLRTLFHSDDDRENYRELIRCINLLLA